MADQTRQQGNTAPQVSLGTKIAFAVGSLLVATAYFTWLDWALMSMQGLDYFYMFRR
jgi:hypothetical protein